MKKDHVAFLREESETSEGDGMPLLAKKYTAVADELEMLRESIRRGGWDIGPCRRCHLPVVCLPDGLPYCEDCAEKQPDG